MKYDIGTFNKEVKHYKSLLKSNKTGDDLLVIFDVEDEKSFFSIAPLSLAVHELKKDVAVMDSKKESIDVLRRFWKSTDKKEFKEFTKIVNDKTKKEFEKIITPPKTILIAKGGVWNILTTQEFLLDESGRLFSDAKSSWHKMQKQKIDLLKKTTSIVWKQVYNLKKNETASIGFALLQDKNIRKQPIEDYLDSFSIAYSMTLSAMKLCRKATMSASSARKSMSDFPEKISDLAATLQGCELDKLVGEEVFFKFNKISKMITAEKLKPADAVFAVKGEGYSGKHIFGQYIGYPTKNKKSRWQTPSQLAYKLPWYPQTKDEERKPMSRLAITDTIPLDIFIETNNIDWFALEKRNRKIMAIIEKSDLIHVRGKRTIHGQTDFVVHIKNELGKRRHPLSSGTDVREKIDKDFLKYGIVAGTYGNIPGGEAFMTPEYIRGTFIGDVVISIDRSYVIPKNNPLVIRCDEKGHKILSGDKNILSALNKERNASLKQLSEMERNGAVSREIANLKKDNFMKIGEFAINTNPKAKLCNYLIVNEKIANMMHIALGSGFDADRASTYHYDIVIDAKTQKMDVYGEIQSKLGKNNKKVWILKNGHFVV